MGDALDPLDQSFASDDGLPDVVSPRGKDHVAAIFSMLDVSGRGMLSKASILRAIHSDERVIALMQASDSLRPLLHPRRYARAFQSMSGGRNSGLVSEEEFLAFVGSRLELLGAAPRNTDIATASQEEDNTLRDVFDKLDLNGDGNVTKREILTALRKDPGLADILRGHPKLSILLKPKQWQDAFARMDTSRDGQINFVEFQAFATLLAGKHEREVHSLKQDIEDVFHLFDKNGDGFVTKRELLAGMRDAKVRSRIENHPKLAVLMHPRKWQKAFVAMDTSQDGKVNLVEFQAFSVLLADRQDDLRRPRSAEDEPEPMTAEEMQAALQDELANICDKKITDAFVKRDELLLDMMQGLAALQTAAGTPLYPPTLEQAGTRPEYPARLKGDGEASDQDQRSPRSKFMLSVSPRFREDRKRYTQARRTRHAELLNAPYLPTVRRGVVWSVNFYEKSYASLETMMKLEPDMRSGPGNSNVYEGKVKEKNKLIDEGKSGRERRLFVIRLKVNIFAELLTQKTVMDKGRELVTPRLTLMMAMNEGKLKVEYTELNHQDMFYTAVQIDKFLFEPLRMDSSMTPLLKRLNTEGNAVLKTIFEDVVGKGYLKNASHWFRMSKRIKCMVQFQFPTETTLKQRHKAPMDLDTYTAVKRIKDFKTKPWAGDLFGFEYPPWSVMEQDDAIVAAERDNESYAGRVAKRMKRNATRRMRHEWIPKEWDLVLVGFDEQKRKSLKNALRKWLNKNDDEVEYILKLCLHHGPKEGKLLRADMNDKECEKMKKYLEEECGAICKIEKENWSNFDDLVDPNGE